MTTSEPHLIPPPPIDPEEIALQDASLVFPSFTAHTAWTLGTHLRTLLMSFPKPAVIDISLANGPHCLFHATTHSGTTPDNDAWVVRKRNTVLRFGVSSWNMHCKFKGDEEAFAAKYGLQGRAGEFAIHGGGWPVRVQGIEGVVAVVVVSGLKQEQDHGIVVLAVREVLEGMGVEVGEKRKED